MLTSVAILAQEALRLASFSCLARQFANLSQDGWPVALPPLLLAYRSVVPEEIEEDDDDGDGDGARASCWRW